MKMSSHIVYIRTLVSDKHLITQILRFALVGLMANLVGYCLYLFMTEFVGVGPKTTVSFLYPIGALMGFIGNHRWTFGYRGRLLGSSFRYIVTHTFGLVLNLSLLSIFVDRFHFPHQLVQAAAIVIVAVFVFVMFRVFVFPSQANTLEKLP